MLYGAELWSNMSDSDILTLERVNRFAAKRAQGLATTTMSEAAIGGLGLWTIEGCIEKKKLLFLRTLILSHPQSVEKVLLIGRMTAFLCEYPFSSVKLGFWPDIKKILEKYDLLRYIDDYLVNGEFPNKSAWRLIVCKSIAQYQSITWRENLTERSNFGLFARVHTELQPLDLWRTAWRNPIYIKPIASLVNVLCGNIPRELINATKEINSKIICLLCNEEVTIGIVMHFIMDCPNTTDERNGIWETLHDNLPIGICAGLFNQDDLSMYETLVSGKLPFYYVNEETRDEFAIITALGLVHVCKRVINDMKDADLS